MQNIKHVGKKNQFGNNKQKKKKTNHSHQNKSEVYTNTARLWTCIQAPLWMLTIFLLKPAQFVSVSIKLIKLYCYAMKTVVT